MIELNVGGTRITTTKETLCFGGKDVNRGSKQQGEGPNAESRCDVLRELFSKLDLHRDANGCVVIDRDAHVFSKVLTWLRRFVTRFH